MERRSARGADEVAGPPGSAFPRLGRIVAIFQGVGRHPNSGNEAPNIRVVSLAAPVRHALTALVALARRPEECLDVSSLNRSLGLPQSALSKCLQRLARRGLLEARRGPGGGYRLTRDPKRVALAEIAEAMDDGDPRLGRCLTEERSCSTFTPCLLHEAAVAANAALKDAMARLTLADAAYGSWHGWSPR